MASTLDGATDLVGPPHDERERQDHHQLARVQSGGPEDRVQPRQVDQCGSQDQFDGDRTQQQWVAGQSDPAQGRPVGPGGEGGPDLAGDDPQPGHGRRLLVEVVQRQTLAGGRVQVPAALVQDVEESGQDQDRGDQPEKSPCSGQQRPPDDPFALGSRRPAHGPRFGGFTAQRKGGKGIGEQIDGQQLHDGQRERDGSAGECEHHERHDLRDCVGEDVENEFADVVVDAAPFFDGVDDGGEVVVGQHHRGSLSCDLGAGSAHGDTDVGGPQRGSIVDPVAGHRHDLTQTAQGVGDAQLGFGRTAGEDDLGGPLEDVVELWVGHRVQVRAGDGGATSRSGTDADLPGDLGGGDPVVAGDDQHPDAGPVGTRDRVFGLRPRRVEHRDHAEQAQAGFGDRAIGRHRLSRAQRSSGHGDQAQTAAAVHLDAISQSGLLAAVQFPGLPDGDGHRRAPAQHRLRCALGLDPQCGGVGVGFDGAHQPQPGVEPEQCLSGLRQVRCGVGMVCGGQLQQGDLGGISSGVVGGDGGRATRGRRAHQQIGQQVAPPFGPGVGRAVDRPGGRRGPVELPRVIHGGRRSGGPQIGDLHPVLGQGSGLVRADHRGGAQCLHGRESFDHGTATGQVLHARGERQGDRGEQPFGHVRHQHPDRETDRGAGGQSCSEPERQECCGDRDGDDGDQFGDLVHLPFQGAALRADPFGQGGDPADLGAHAGRGHDCAGLPCDAGAAAEQHVRRRQQIDVGIAPVGAAGDGLGFTGQGGQIDVRRSGDQSGVGADSIALLDQQDVARNQRRCCDVRGRSVPEDPCLGGQVGRERLDGMFGVSFLEEGEHRIEHDDRQDRESQWHTATDHRQDGCGQQQQCQRCGELGEQLTRPLRPAPPGQLVGTVGDQSACGVPTGQAQGRTPQVAEDQLQRLGGVHHRRVHDRLRPFWSRRQRHGGPDGGDRWRTSSYVLGPVMVSAQR